MNLLCNSVDTFLTTGEDWGILSVFLLFTPFAGFPLNGNISGFPLTPVLSVNVGHFDFFNINIVFRKINTTKVSLYVSHISNRKDWN